MRISEQELKAVLKLSGQERYNYFIKRVVDAERIWGLYDDGWASAATDERETVFPVWPAKEYAVACAIEEWEGYTPKEIALEEFKNIMIPELVRDGIKIGVFPTPTEKGVTPTSIQLLDEITEEERKYV